MKKAANRQATPNVSTKKCLSPDILGGYVLFIQMQSLELNLKTWIVEGNSSVAPHGSNLWIAVNNNNEQNVNIL